MRTQLLSYFTEKLTIPVLLCAAFLCSVHAYGARYPHRADKYLDSLDMHVDRAENYTRAVVDKLERRRHGLKGMKCEQRLEELAAIGQRYEQISMDSALSVYDAGAELARTCHNSRYRHKFEYRKGSVLAMMSLVREGIERFIAVPLDSLDPADKFDYFVVGNHIADAAIDYYAVDSLQRRYRLMSSRCLDSVVVYTQPGTVEALYYRALPRMNSPEYKIGMAELTEVMSRVDIDDPLFAKAAASIAGASVKNGDRESARYFYAVSAMGDLQAGTREATSLHRLGALLYDDKDYERAYNYLTYSLSAAVMSGSRVRTLEIGQIMPMVVNAGRELERSRNRTLMVIAIVLGVVILIGACVLVFAFRTSRRLHRVRKELAVHSDSKDGYIRKLLMLCGVYLTALENFNKLAGRKIKVGQVQDLLAMIDSGRVMREQLQTFYEVFDDAFLMVYPDFVDKVNKYLLPDRQLKLAEDGRLGTELRILAFMRLGLDDSAQIAKFLGLSLNTVYTYRNKVKARARNREEFENQVRNIDKAS